MLQPIDLQRSWGAHYILREAFCQDRPTARECKRDDLSSLEPFTSLR